MGLKTRSDNRMLGNTMTRLLTALGPFRTFLAASTLLMVLCAPFSLGASYYEDWRIVPTVVVPVFAVMLLFLLPLDMLMSWVFAAGDSERRARLRNIIRIEAGLLALLVFAWTPFAMQLAPA